VKRFYPPLWAIVWVVGMLPEVCFEMCYLELNLAES
jgi:hypothetical protein